MHEHTALSPTARHCELGPQGEGIHGFVGWRSSEGPSVLIKITYYYSTQGIEWNG